jgi:membrane-bound lytic murein transglycosylase MltF
MQVLPRTASDKHINIKNVHLLDNNIHAGTKYLNFLRTRYFSSTEIEPADRVYFSWAAYNAGPAKINRIRKETARRGFNPDKWFSNVEKIASEIIGRETVDYVSNINKYFVAYQLYFDVYQKRSKAKKSLHIK